MSDYHVDCIVIGGGVVGLAIARRLALAGLETFVLEKNAAIGMETSSRNSEVIHAGLYYPTGSIRAKACVSGRRMLYRYCALRNVPFKKCGKLMLATSQDQLPKLKTIYENAIANGVEGLSWQTKEEINAVEPEVKCVSGFLSAETGIIDSHGFMQALEADLLNAGGSVVLNTRVLQLTPQAGSIVVTTADASETTISARYVINAAGHGAPKLAAATAGLSEVAVPRQWYAKGNYFSLSGGRQPFSRLIYPLPEAAGLGVHATLDLDGNCRFGPDVEWVEREDDLAVDPARAHAFYEAIRIYWPGLEEGRLEPAYSGMRPKLHDASIPQPDFRIDGPAEHGVDGLVNLFGIESPGLTSSLALADLVVDRLGISGSLTDAAE
ncbi:NAD(P)/FAD-dependent oxidoreductase [Rhizobium sp. 18055]|uniref:NAD(P)/FAD-dependent oxidoreductase n=1 Tax=Rhizobium sp. 18055 TaxID=2681403 RepID=UPI00135CEA97|nr:NAD(P)/FAD-dependent oxidoreductase [Rhizobium sp. 18055]